MHPCVCKLCVPFGGFTALSRDPSQSNLFLSVPRTEATATMEGVCYTFRHIFMKSLVFLKLFIFK